MAKRIDWNQTVHKLRAFCRVRRRAPSFEEVRRLFDYKSKNTAHWLIARLVDKGLVRKDSEGRLLFDGLTGIRLLGSVQAGWPSPAEEELVDTMSLDDYLIRNPQQSFLIKVTGDSMIDAGIHPGDLVIVERGRAPQNNDIVIAQVDGEWTIKFYQKRGSGVRLAPANPKYPIITPKEELKIGGVVVSCIRRYK
ncbi:MAG: repressor LexA [Candidatus Omnitrophica bacterium]|jgi:SOS regulatory protein LexA|nr:repressor LexA [Candidatus Omnitrophota bacterium]